MGEFSITHLLILGAVVLLFFGPSRLPKAGRAIGEAIRGFKKGIKGDEIDVTEQSLKPRDKNQDT
jgi:sec-independent protein translocase protein TatA